MVEYGTKKSAQFIAYSAKTKSACLDQGEGEAWWPCSPDVQRFIPKVRKGSVEIEQDEFGAIVFIKNTGTSQSRAPKQGFEGFKTNDWNQSNAERQTSIEAQCILKVANDAAIEQMKQASLKNGQIEWDVALSANATIAMNQLKKIKGEL